MPIAKDTQVKKKDDMEVQEKHYVPDFLIRAQFEHSPQLETLNLSQQHFLHHWPIYFHVILYL